MQIEIDKTTETASDDREMMSAIESMLFVWGEPLGLSRIAKILDIKPTHAERLLEEMMRVSEAEGRGIQILEVDKHYQLCTRKENYAYIETLCQTSKSRGLSNSALEVLTIVAYKQPITKLDIEQVRGVNSDAALQSLTERGLVDIVGRLERIGRPHLYGTTQLFLKTFGLKTISELPTLDAFETFRAFETEKEADDAPDQNDET
ncbi:MAG: segregation and condensation protein [Clostridiales bacterium]|nr:segregation and condensation protein [Clostridiales bacterium]